MAVIIEVKPNYVNHKNNMKNVIEKDVQLLFKPFNIIRTIFVCSFYKIQDDIITTNSFLYDMLTVIGSCMLLIIYYISLFSTILSEAIEGFNFIKCFCNIFIYAAYFMGNVTNFCCTIIRKKNNVTFALKIQNVSDAIVINGNSLKDFITFNWIYVGLVVFFHNFWIFFYYFTFSSTFHFDEIVTNYVYMVFDVTILYCARVMRLLWHPLRIWVEDVEKSKFIADLDNEYYWNRMFRIHLEVIETYQTAGNTFHPLILYYTVGTFVNAVLSLTLRIEMGKSSGDCMSTFVLLSSMALFWMVKNMFIIIALSVETERLYSAIREVWDTCTLLTTAKMCSAAQKRVCKNIQRIQTTSFKKMNACGLFVVDGAFPLRLLGIITTYVIVVLQFEFVHS